MDGTGAPTTTRVIRVGDRDVGEVWLERDAGAEPLDELVVERMALAAGILWHGSTRPSRSATALIELVVTNSTSPEERGRALRLLGFHPERPLSIVGPSSYELDMSLSRTFTIHESQKVQFRWEAFNVTNEGILSGIGGSSLTSSTFGQFTSAGNPRIQQAALKYIF